MLQAGKDQGLVVPHARAYFLASQIQQLGGWGVIALSDSIRNVLIPEESAHSALLHLEGGFSHLGFELTNCMFTKQTMVIH